MRKSGFLLIFAILLILLAACGGDEATPTPQPTPLPEATATETVIEEPAPASNPTEVSAPEPAPAATETPLPEEPETVEEPGIVGITWLWGAFQDQAEINDRTVTNPELYTLALLPDGTAAIQADCNQVQWTYTIEGSSLTFNTLGPSTLAYCGETSLDQLYLEMLADVVTYVSEDGKLFLNLKLDAGNMVFDHAGGINIEPDQISLDTQGLPYAWQAVVVPATPYDESQPPGPKGLPEHIEILFGVNDPADRQFGDPIMYIIPVDAYRQMWAEADNASVGTAIDQIEQLSLFAPIEAPTSGVPVLPAEEIGGVNDLAVQFLHVGPGGELNTSSATQNGYRFVGRWAQDANPVTNQGLRYVYQGFTNNGEYLVSFWYPVSSSEIPNEVGDVPSDEMDQFNSDFNAYMAGQVAKLNNLSADQWNPDLTTLDALVASLQIEDLPIGGIQDKIWQWSEGPVEPGSSEIVIIENPENYQVVYGSDGLINFVADCNSGSMSYELNIGGMSGSMLAQAGPMTLAECEPGSYYQSFVNSLMAAQDYRVSAGGDPLELVLPAGGGVLIMQDEAAATAESSERPDLEASSEEEELYIIPDEGLPPDFIQLSLQGLADTYAWTVVDGTPISPGPGGQGFPTHIVLGFDGQNPLEIPYPERKIMYVFPAQAYIELYQANGSDIVGQQVVRLEELIATAEDRQGDPAGWMPLLPPPNSLMDRWVQFSDLNFNQGEGVRYVSDSPLRQSIGVWTNQGTDYYYQGLTSNGQFYISFKWPVSTSSLSDTTEGASEEAQSQANNPETYDAYQQATRDSLNALPPSGWSPDLSRLDAMISSLELQFQ